MNDIVKAWEDVGSPRPYSTFREGYQAALQSQDRESEKRVINAARKAMDRSTESYDGRGGIVLDSDDAASLSLALDDYDHARRVEGDGK